MTENNKVISFPTNKAALMDVEFGFITFSDRSFIIEDPKQLKKLTEFINKENITLIEVF